MSFQAWGSRRNRLNAIGIIFARLAVNADLSRISPRQNPYESLIRPFDCPNPPRPRSRSRHPNPARPRLVCGTSTIRRGGISLLMVVVVLLGLLARKAIEHDDEDEHDKDAAGFLLVLVVVVVLIVG